MALTASRASGNTSGKWGAKLTKAMARYSSYPMALAASKASGNKEDGTYSRIAFKHAT